MDELEILKLRNKSLEKRNERLVLESWECDMLLKAIANKVVEEKSFSDHFTIHLYSELNPIIKALDIKLNPKWVKDLNKAKEDLNNDRSTKI